MWLVIGLPVLLAAFLLKPLDRDTGRRGSGYDMRPICVDQPARARQTTSCATRREIGEPDAKSRDHVPPPTPSGPARRARLRKRRIELVAQPMPEGTSFVVWALIGPPENARQAGSNWRRDTSAGVVRQPAHVSRGRSACREVDHLRRPPGFQDPSPLLDELVAVSEL